MRALGFNGNAAASQCHVSLSSCVEVVHAAEAASVRGWRLKASHVDARVFALCIDRRANRQTWAWLCRGRSDIRLYPETIMSTVIHCVIVTVGLFQSDVHDSHVGLALVGVGRHRNGDGLGNE